MRQLQVIVLYLSKTSVESLRKQGSVPGKTEIDRQYSFTSSLLRGQKYSFIQFFLCFQFLWICLRQFNIIFENKPEIYNYCKEFITWMLIESLFSRKLFKDFRKFYEIILQLFYLILLQQPLYDFFPSSSFSQRNYLICGSIKAAYGVLNILISKIICMSLSKQQAMLRQEGYREKTPVLRSLMSYIAHYISIATLYLEVDDYTIGQLFLDALKNYRRN